MKDEAGDIVSERQSGVVVEPCVLAGVDATQTRFLRSGAEAAERARDARQCRRGEREVLRVAVEGGEHVGAGGADRAVRAGVRGVGCGCRASCEGRAAFAAHCPSRERGSCCSRCRSSHLATALRDCSSGAAAGCRIRCASVFCAPRVLPLHFGHRPVRRLRSSINIATFPGRFRPDGESI